MSFAANLGELFFFYIYSLVDGGSWSPYMTHNQLLCFLMFLQLCVLLCGPWGEAMVAWCLYEFLKRLPPVVPPTPFLSLFSLVVGRYFSPYVTHHQLYVSLSSYNFGFFSVAPGVKPWLPGVCTNSSRDCHSVVRPGIWTLDQLWIRESVTLGLSSLV